MSLWLRSPCLVGVGMREVLALKPERSGVSEVIAVAPLDPAIAAGKPGTRSWDAPLSAIMTEAAQHGDAVHVTLSDDWIRYWYVTPPEGLGSLAELRAMVTARFEDLFGVQASGWAIEADWQSSGGVFASAMSLPMRNALQTAAATAKLRLASVMPAAVRWFNRHAAELTPDCWYCSFGERTVTAVQFAGGKLLHVRRLRYDVLPEAEEIIGRLESESLRQGSPMPARVFFAGQAPAPASSMVGKVLVTLLGRQLSRQAVRSKSAQPTEEATQLAFSGWRP